MFGVCFIALVGFILGIKMTLLFQVFLVVILLAFCLKDSDEREGLENAIIGFVLMFGAIGMVLGDWYYYANYYQGTATFGSTIGWLFRP